MIMVVVVAAMSLLSLRLQLSRDGAGAAAELGVVLVGAVLGPHDQLAVGKVRVVFAGLKKGKGHFGNAPFVFPTCASLSNLELSSQGGSPTPVTL